MERVRNSVKGYYWGRLITCFLACSLFLNTSLPIVQAEVVYQPEHLNNRGLITVSPLEHSAQNIFAEDRAIGHFSNFDIATGHIVNCAQTVSTDSALFRVSGDRTEIMGQFNANSNIYLINTAGILFGPESEIHVNRLIASGLNMSNEAFDAVLAGGRMVFDTGNGEVKNDHGTIYGNSIYLIGKKIYNLGPVIARDGLIVMAAGDQVRLYQDGSDVSVVSSPGDDIADIRIGNVVSATNGKIVLAAGDTFSRAILNGSIIDATGGTVTVQAARVENRGKISADARDTADGDGGNITLAGTEEVIIGPDGMDNTGMVSANAGVNGIGGTITIESAGTVEFEGNVNLQQNSLISARGGSISGNGGLVKITTETFTIGGDIYANPASADFEPGTLIIDPSSVTIANGLNPAIGDLPVEPAVNTLYEVDIENLSDKGTSVVVHADDSITVEDMISDGTIKGGFGNIELHATGLTSSVTFEDNTNTIKTTLGDIAISSGSGGLNIGNLITGDAELGAAPGQIILSAAQAGDIYSGGDITTGDLIIEGGSGHAEINVTASGELNVNGDVIVGRTTPIDNIPEGPDASDAEAMIYLKAGDHANINQQVSASADATNPGDSTAYIEISAGTNNVVEGDAFINGNVLADASASDGTAEAIVKIEAWGSVNFAEGVEVHATGDDKTAEATEQTNYEDDEDPDPYESGDHAQIIIKAENKSLTGLPDIFPDNHMGSLIEGNVLTNDLGPADKAELVTDPSHAESFTLNEDGTFSYTPKAGYVGDDTFTYRVTSETEEPTGPVLVTITMTNDLPAVTNEVEVIHMGDPLNGNVLTNDTDINEDQLKVALDGTAPEHGQVTLNEDGTYTYTPDDGYVGEDSFKYEVADGQLDELGNPVVVIGTATITMSNDLPVLTNEPEVIHMGDPLSGNVLSSDNANDINGDQLKVALDGTAPEHGQLTLLEDGTYTYTPDEGYVGEDSFKYEVTDGQLDELDNPVVVVGTATITIGNNPPTPKDDAVTTRTSESVTGNVLKNDTDPDNDTLSVVLNGTAPEHGTLKLNADGSFTYTSDDEFVGEDKFTYIVTDGAIDAEPLIGTVIVTVDRQPIYIAPAPLPERIEFEISGYPALAKWVAEELGVDERMIDIWIVNTLASSKGIHPVDTYATLKAAAIILKDSDGVYIDALTQVVNEFASSFTPPTEEQMASIAEAITRNGDEDSHYALAGKYLRALADYIGILNYEMGFSSIESVQFVTDKYINRLTGDENVGVAAFLAASASALAG